MWELRATTNSKNILVECNSLQDIQEKYSMMSFVKELFDSVDNQSIIGLYRNSFL